MTTLRTEQVSGAFDELVITTAIEQPTDTGPLYSQRRAKFTAIVGAAALGTGTMLGAAGEIYAHDTHLVPELAANCLVSESGNVPLSQQQAFNHEVDRPEPADVKAVMTGVLHNPSFERDYELLAMEKAKEAGLSIIDPEPYRDIIQKASSVEDITKELNSYTDQLGFQITLHTKTDLIDTGFGVRPLNKQLIDVAQFKKGALDFLDVYGLLPKELQEYADIHEVRIVDSLHQRTNGAVGTFSPIGEANVVSGVIYIPLANLYSGNFELYMHELSHRIDYKMRGGLCGMFFDPAYTSLNPQGFRYGQTADTSASDAVVNQYGDANAAEDKAVMNQDLLNGFDDNSLYSDSPSIRAKYRLLAERIEEKVPGYATYLFDISGGKIQPSK